MYGDSSAPSTTRQAAERDDGLDEVGRREVRRRRHARAGALGAGGAFAGGGGAFAGTLSGSTVMDFDGPRRLMDARYRGAAGPSASTTSVRQAVKQRDTEGASPMASVEQQTPATANGAAGDIAVENPATGRVIGTVPDLGAEQVAELARRGRAAQPAWEALGFDGRGRVLRRAQRWLMTNADRVIDTIVSETGKAWEDAQAAELAYGAQAFGFWAKEAPKYLADERVKSASIFVAGKRLVLRYRPLGLVGVIGPWNYPLTNSFGDCIPALAAGNSVILKPSEITPLTTSCSPRACASAGCPRTSSRSRPAGRARARR